MAITASNLIHSGSNSANTSYTTASISPTANRLVILAVGSRNNSGNTIPTVTGASMTWTEIAHFVGTNNRTVTLFRALSASPGSGALTIDFAGNSQTICTWSVDQFDGIDTTGTNGSGAIAQSAGNSQATTTTGMTVTLAALAGSTSAAYGYCMTNGATTVVKGAALTELSNSTIATSAVGEAEWALNVTAVNWTWASTNYNVVGMAIEIKPPTIGGKLFRTSNLDGIGSGGPFFSNPAG